MHFPLRLESYFLQETDRLTLRRLTEADIENWIDFFDNNDSLKYLGVDLSKSNETNANDWVMRQLERYKDLGLGHLGVIEKSSGQFIGMAGIVPRTVDEKEYLEISYSLKPAYWGKGYGTEAARQVKKFGFENELTNQFISIIDKENTASIHVAEKNDMIVLFESEFMGMDVFVFGTESN